MSAVDAQAPFGPEIDLDGVACTTSPGARKLTNCSAWRWQGERTGETCLMASHSAINGISLVGPRQKPGTTDQAGGTET